MKKMYKFIIGIAAIAVLVAVVQISGLGQMIRDNGLTAHCEGGTCAMKLYKKNMEEK